MAMVCVNVELHVGSYENSLDTYRYVFSCLCCVYSIPE